MAMELRHDELRQDQNYTYEEWCNLDTDKRTELIDGQIYMMADPTSRHQEVLSELFGQLWSFLRDKPCRVYIAPFAVRMYSFKDTAFEPEIVILCDPSKRRKRGCEGAPDMVVEILSPSTERNDRVLKYKEYMAAGVKEYWIVHPDDNYVTANRLIDGKYISETYFETDKAPVLILPGCEIDLTVVFKDLFKAPNN